ncbi:L1CAM protein, partial [Podargus strigoides]|nr:L1CAM protein [Podargus strigoides]
HPNPPSPPINPSPAAATRIEVPPRSTTAKRGETVTFRCAAAFDPTLAPRGLEWRWDGRLLREAADSDK